MDKDYLKFRDIVEADPEYQELRRLNLCATVQFQKLLQRLEQEDKEIIYEYIGTLAELQMWEIELALML